MFHITPSCDAASECLEERLRVGELRELFFFVLELPWMDTTPSAARPDRMLEVEHLVVDDVFDGIARHPRVIEQAADDDGVVGGVVMSEASARMGSAPCQLRAGQQAPEESLVQVLEDGPRTQWISMASAMFFRRSRPSLSKR